MGEKWDARSRGEELARQKVPQVRGVSARTAKEIEDGKREIVPDTDQAELLAELIESGEWHGRGTPTDT